MYSSVLLRVARTAGFCDSMYSWGLVVYVWRRSGDARKRLDELGERAKLDSTKIQFCIQSIFHLHRAGPSSHFALAAMAIPTLFDATDV